MCEKDNVVPLARRPRLFVIDDDPVDGAGKAGVESFEATVQKVVTEAMDLITAGLALIYWHWYGEVLTLAFRLPPAYIEYRARRSHAKVVFGKIKTIYAPSLGSAFNSRRRDGPIEIREVVEVIVPDEQDLLIVRMRVVQWLGRDKLRKERQPGDDPMTATECEAELDPGKNDADFVCAFTFACK